MMHTRNEQLGFATGSLQADLMAMMTQYVNQAGSRLHEQRKQDFLAIKALVQHTASVPVLQNLVEDYLVNLAMPLSGFKLYLGRRGYSRFRALLRKTLHFHSQQQVIERLKQQVVAEQEAKKLLANEYQKNIDNISAAYEEKVKTLQCQLLDTQKKVDMICRFIAEGQSVQLTPAQQPIRLMQGVDQSTVINELQQENARLHAMLARYQQQEDKPEETSNLNNTDATLRPLNV